eukprot:scaffold2223_cov46-Cyclotella_meneghiniana.AAC.3
MVFPTLVGLALTGPITQFQRLIKGSWTIYGLQSTGFLHGQVPASSYRLHLITSRFGSIEVDRVLFICCPSNSSFSSTRSGGSKVARDVDSGLFLIFLFMFIGAI